MPVVDPEEMGRLFNRIWPRGLGGRTMFDVGCNGGAYCIHAHRMGASQTFGFDSRQHWIDQARFLARHFGHDQALFEAKALHEVAFERDYDICMFKGVLYHLPDPVHALQTVCDRTRELIVIDTATDGERGDLCFRLNPEGTENLMTGMHGLAWWPSGPDLMEAIMPRLGFPEVREIFFRPQTNRHGRSKAGRMRLIAARDKAALAAFDRKRG